MATADDLKMEEEAAVEEVVEVMGTSKSVSVSGGRDASHESDWRRGNGTESVNLIADSDIPYSFPCFQNSHEK
jgi:hypothetical protein